MNEPTVVLVHGAFADAASWTPVTQALLAAGHQVAAVPNHLRSLSGDAASVRRVVEAIDGPVLLVGHSYGGAVITVAGVAENVVGLVYVAAYTPEEGESPSDMDARFPATSLRDHLVSLPTTDPADDQDVDLSVAPEAFLPVFAAGMDEETAAVLAVSQRPFAVAAYTEAASAAAWKAKPSWGIVATADQTVQPEVERSGYERAGFREVIEVDGPHLLMHTHPADVVRVIVRALSETADHTV